MALYRYLFVSPLSSHSVLEHHTNHFYSYSTLIESTQSDLEKAYARLLEIAEEKHSKLDENLKLYQFSREVRYVI